MLYLKARYNLGFVRDPFLLVRAQLPIWDTTCATTITMAPSDRQDKKPKDASPWLWTAPRNSVSLSALSASAAPLLVNMHASDIQQNQAWAFVSLLCHVLYYGIIEWQNCPTRKAKPGRCVSFYWFYSQISSTKNPITGSKSLHPHPPFQFRIPVSCRFSPHISKQTVRELCARHAERQTGREWLICLTLQAQPVVKHKTFESGTNWVCAAHKSGSPPETQFCK